MLNTDYMTIGLFQGWRIFERYHTQANLLSLPEIVLPNPLQSQQQLFDLCETINPMCTTNWSIKITRTEYPMPRGMMGNRPTHALVFISQDDYNLIRLSGAVS